jgi:hypothetical protein
MVHERQWPSRPFRLELRRKRIFVTEPSNFGSGELLHRGRQHQHRNVIAVLAATVKVELRIAPQRLEHVSGKLSLRVRCHARTIASK